MASNTDKAPEAKSTASSSHGPARGHNFHKLKHTENGERERGETNSQHMSKKGSTRHLKREIEGHLYPGERHTAEHESKRVRGAGARPSPLTG